jgi:hypothetical protein
MLRWMGRALVILFVTGLVSGGVYWLGQTDAGRAMLRVSGDMEGGPRGMERGGSQTGDGSGEGAAVGRNGSGQRPSGAGLGPGGRGQRPEGASAAGVEGGRPEGGRGERGGPGGIGLAGILKNVITIAVFTVVIALAQTMWGLVSRIRQPKPA